MTIRHSLLRRTAASVAGLLLATVMVVAPSVEQRVVQASTVSTVDTFANFSGSQYFRAADTDAFDRTGDMTLSVWLRPTSTCVGGECVFVTKENSYIFAIKNGKFDYALSTSTSGNWDWRGTGVTPIVNQWQHVSFAVSRGTNTMSMYVNGSLAYSVTDTTDVPTTGPNNTDDFSIGARSRNGWRSFFNGAIDEVRIYNVSRASAAQAQADMNTWGSDDTTGLGVYYDFNEGSGTTLNNKASGAASNTNLSATGSPTWSDVKSTTQSGGKVVVTFARTYLTSVGGWTPPAGVSEANALIVAGGGGGGASFDGPGAGGGGAGGVVDRWTSGSVSISSSAMQVVVGVGGLGNWGPANATARSQWNQSGRDGTNSSFASLTAIGGGGGGGRALSGQPGGSGGGAGGRNAGGSQSGFVTDIGGTGVAGQGYAGGRPLADFGSGGGGGGAGGVGGNSNGTTRGNGGNGASYSIAGTSRTFSVGGTGGLLNGTVLKRDTGSENTGSGGGGGDGINSGTIGGSGGDGATGVVIIAYAMPCEVQQWTGAGGSTLIQYQVPSGFDSCTTNLTTPSNVTALDAVLVGGGGGGGGGNERGTSGGGGGGGQVLNMRAQTVSANTTYQIVVGRGGTGGAGSPAYGTAAASGTAGVASSAFGSTASGGSGGGGASASGSAELTASGYGGSSGGGNAGGNPNWEGGGGGAGSGSPGNNAADGNGAVPRAGVGGTGGYGGNGVLPGWVIGWCSGMFGGGGGGGSAGTDITYPLPLGGAGGGGNGATGTTAPTAGTAHCGGGGGGGGGHSASRNGANGGSGVVYVRYHHAYSAESFTDGSDISVELGTATNLGLGSNVVTDYVVGETVRVRVNATNGTISIPSASGVTVTGNNSASVTLVGSQTNLNTALASATLTTSSLVSTQITLDIDMNPVSQTIGIYTYTPHTNGHFYTFRSRTNARVWEAAADAIGMQLGGRQGFLATPTSADEMTVMRTVAGSSSAWIGITDDFQENTFRLIGEDAWGPISTGSTASSGRYTNWATNEPNNSGGSELYNNVGSEDFVQINSGSSTWNDHRPFAAMGGAIVEFEPKSSRRVHNVTFTKSATRTATVSTASNLGLGATYIGASTFVNDETIVATITAPTGSTMSATGTATVTGSGTRTLTIEGTKATVNATLNNVAVTAGSTGDKTITVTYRAKTANNGTSSNYKYNSGTGNYYLSLGTGTYASAESDANAAFFGGVRGSNVSVNSATEQSWLNTNISSGAFWTALNDIDNEGQWTMRTRDAYQTSGFDNNVLPGGYLPWNANEPNGARAQNCHVSQWNSLAGDDGTCTTTTITRVAEFRPYAVTQDLTIAVNGSPSISTPTTDLTATVGEAYSLTVTATGGVTPYSFALASGTLPSGLTLSSSGVISGTATDAPQTQAVTVRVTDANGATATTSSFILTTDATTCTTATTIVGGHTVQRFTDVGYCQWQVPAGVTSVDGFVVGGGGGGGTDGGEGGGGGGYHPRNGIAVTPGEILTIRVGDGGSAGIWQGSGATSGQSSFVTRGTTQLLNANGGAAGISGPVGTAGAAGGTSAGGFTGGKGGSASTENGTRGTMGAVGVVNYFLGVVNEYSGGGGGGIFDSGTYNLSSAFGLSGGGSGCDATSTNLNTTGFPGRVNSGGGGGGGCAGLQTNGGAGGSGIAMIRYTTDPLDAFPADISGLQARFVADDYQTLDSNRKTWIDSSNSARHGTSIAGTPNITEVTGNGSSKTVRTVNGGTSANVTFPSTVISSNTYTLFHLARYSGSTKGRIFTNSSGNWLSGFWSGRSGVAHHNGWMTGNTSSNASTSAWVLSSDQNTLYRANGQSFTTSTTGLSFTGSLGVNLGYSAVEFSDWQVPEIIVYNRVLSAEEIRRVESYLTRTYGLLGYDSTDTSQGVLTPRTVSAAKTGNASTGSSSQLSVTWTAPTDTQGITDYKVEYKPQSDSTWSTWSHTASASLTSATLTGLSSATTYDIRVTAVDSGAINRPSATTTATTWGTSSVALTSVPTNPKTSTTYTLTATVTGAGDTTGTVSFMENGVVISGCATRTIAVGIATCTWVPMTLGTRSLTASFTGDSSVLASTTSTATTLIVETGICITTAGTTGRFTYWEIRDAVTCVLPALPAGVESLDVLTVGGGGGGGENAGSGGGGGGAYYVTNSAVAPTDEIEIIVGAGGRAGAVGNTADASALRDGGAGASSSISWDGRTYIGTGGAGGQTRWADNKCGGAGLETSVINGGSGTGAGGTSLNGGVGGQGGTAGGIAGSAGGAGQLNNITGTNTRYGGGGGGGGWGAAGGAGGSGGGGAGGTSFGTGSNGIANTGGGGGGGSDGCQFGGQGGSGVVIVRFANVPTIATQPVAASKVRGQSHTFNVTPSATGATTTDFTYQWKKDGVAIDGATSSTYTIASLSTADAGTYSVTVKSSSGGFAVSSTESVEVELTVDKASQTITFGTLAAKTYGDSDFSITASSTSGLLISFTSSNTTVCSVSVGVVSSGVTTATIDVRDAGSCDITAAQVGDSEYLVATSVTRTLVVNKKSLLVTGLVGANKTYDRTDTASVTFTGYSFGSGVVGSDAVTLVDTSAEARFSDRNVANGKTITITGLTLGGADADNYQLSTPVTTTASITAKEIFATGITAADRTYDGGRVASLDTDNEALTGVILGDAVSLTGVAVGTFDTKEVGENKEVSVSGLLLSGDDAGNYSLAAYTTLADITAKQISLSGLSGVDRVYDRGTVAGLTGTASLNDVVSGDSVTLSGTAVGAFDDRHVGENKVVRVSGLSLSGDDAGNYSLAAYTTLADVTAKQISLSGLSGVDRIYDGGVVAQLTGTASLVGVITNDSVTLSGTAVGAFDDRHVGENKVVRVSGLSLSGDDAGNYSLAAYTTLADVTAKQISLSGLSGVDRVYDRGTVAGLTGTASLNDVVSGDSVTLSGTAVGAFDDRHVGENKIVRVSGLSLSGDDAGNYSLAAYTTLADVTAKELTLSGLSGVDRIYNGGIAAELSGTAVLNGVITGDAVLLTGTATGTFNDKDVEANKPVTVTGLSLTGNDASNYTLASYTAVATITAKQLTVTGITASDKNYDKTRVAVVQHGLAQLQGVVTNDDVRIVTTQIAGLFDTALVGENKTVQISGVALDGVDAGNYEVVQPTTTAAISTKTITVSGVTAENKIYDAQVDADVSFELATMSGVEIGDTVELVDTDGRGEFVAADVGDNKTVTISGLVITGADAANYRLIQPTATANIEAKQIFAMGITASNRVYNGLTSAALTTTGAGLLGVVAGDAVTINTTFASGSFSSRHVDDDKTVTVLGLSLDGDDAGNYLLATYTTTASISEKQISLSGLSGVDRVYDGGTVAGLSGTASLNGVVSGDVVNLAGTAIGAFDDRHVGENKVVRVSGLSLSGDDAGNYLLAAYTTSASISEKQISLSGLSGVDRVYDGGTVAAVTGTASLNDVVSGDSVTLSGTAVGAFATKIVGENKPVTVTGLSLSGDDAGNYLLAAYTTLADVTAKELTLSGLSGVDRVYDGGTVAAVTGTASLNDVVSGDSVTLSGTAVGAFDDRHVGENKVVRVSGLSLSGDDAGNYLLAAYTTLADVTAKELTLSGLSGVDRVYDGGTVAAVTGTASLNGVVSGDSVSLFGTAVGAFATKIVGENKPVTVTGLSLSGTHAENYSLAGYATTATISAKQISASGITAASRVYNGSDAAVLDVTDKRLLGVVSGDVVTLLTGSATGSFSNKNADENKTVTVNGLSLGGDDAGNYSLAAYTTSASISRKQISLSGLSGVDRVYDGGTVAAVTGTATLNGVVSGDSVSLSGTTVGAFDTKVAEENKVVRVSGLTLSGTDAANYSLDEYTTSAEISRKTLNVTGVTVATKQYDASRDATVWFTAAAFSGRIAGDDLRWNTNAVAALFDNKTAVPNKTVQVSGLVLEGVDAANYQLVQPTATGEITKKPLQVVGVTSAGRIYDGGVIAPIDVSNASFSGVMSGDIVVMDRANPTATYANKIVGTNKNVTVSNINATGTDGANYTVPSFTVTSSIAVRPISVVGATAGSRVYDGSRNATAILNLSAATLTNVVSGDSLSFDTTAATGQFRDRHVGASKLIDVTGLVVSGTDATNYALNPVELRGAVTPKPLQVEGISAAHHIYDGLTDASDRVDMTGATLVGIAHVDDVVELSVSAMQAHFLNPLVEQNKTITVSGLTLDGKHAANYSLDQPSLTADITQRELTITGITVASREYNGTTAATALLSLNNAALANTVSGDDVVLGTAGVSASFTQKTVGTNKSVTMAGFTISGADAANYRLRQPTGNASITARPVTVSGITATDKVYDGTAIAEISVTNAVVSGVLSNDIALLNTMSAVGSFADAQVGQNKIVRITGLTLTGVDATNYSVTIPTTTASIFSAVTPWMDYRAETNTLTPDVGVQAQIQTQAVPQLPPAPARVTTRSVSRGAAMRVTAVRAPQDAAIPVNRAIITVTSTATRKVLARINVQVDPNNPTTSVTVPYSSRRVRVTVQFANSVGISVGPTQGINVAEGNTFEWSSVEGQPQIRGTEIPGSVTFSRGSSTLTTAMKKQLSKVARAARSRNGLVFVTGYAQQGELRSSWLLDSLARKRAQAVANYLSGLGVRQWITYQGHTSARDSWNPARERRVVVSTEQVFE